MANPPTVYYVDPAIDADSGAGTVGDPYGDLQHCLDTITRDTGQGDRICVKAGTDEVLAASLTLATYGSPSPYVPLIIQGYTSAAQDGGIGVIDFCICCYTHKRYIFIIKSDLHIGTICGGTITQTNQGRSPDSPNNASTDYFNAMIESLNSTKCSVCHFKFLTRKRGEPKPTPNLLL